MNRIAHELNTAIDKLELLAHSQSGTGAGDQALFAPYSLRDLLIEQGLYDEDA